MEIHKEELYNLYFGKYKNIHEHFSTDFGVRYRPLIPNSLSVSVHHTLMNTFKVPISLELLIPRQKF